MAHDETEGAQLPPLAAKTLRVLILEDDPDLAEILRRGLERAAGAMGANELAMQMTCCVRMGEAAQQLTTGTFDVMLLDLNVPDSVGVDTYRAMQAAAPAVPAVILTSIEDQETAAEAVAAGATEFLVKGNQTAEVILRALTFAPLRYRSS